MIDRLGYARSSAASALRSLTDSAEWTEKAIRSGSATVTHTEELIATRNRLWAMANTARGVEHALANIYTASRLAAEDGDENAA